MYWHMLLRQSFFRGQKSACNMAQWWRKASWWNALRSRTHVWIQTIKPEYLESLESPACSSWTQQAKQSESLSFLWPTLLKWFELGRLPMAAKFYVSRVAVQCTCGLPSGEESISLTSALLLFVFTKPICLKIAKGRKDWKKLMRTVQQWEACKMTC